MTAASVAELPDDPVELHTRLLRNTAPGAPADVQVLKSAASLLGGSPTTPAVRAALFRMCSTLPGVISDGPARDELNRPGVQVHLERTIPHSQGARIRVVMIVAPDTARILQLEMFMVGEKSTPMIYVRSGYVHSIGDVPAS
jgi:hypothetical protein